MNILINLLSNKVILLTVILFCFYYHNLIGQNRTEYTEHGPEPDPAAYIHERYDCKGNLIEYHYKNNFSVTYIWGYNYLYLIAKIDNAIYDHVMSVLELSYEELQTKTSEELEVIFQSLREFQAMKHAMIYSYTYSLIGGMTSETSPNGIKTTYEYDDFGRLSNVMVRWSEKLGQEP